MYTMSTGKQASAQAKTLKAMLYSRQQWVENMCIAWLSNGIISSAMSAQWHVHAFMCANIENGHWCVSVVRDFFSDFCSI